ncbi:MAG TPA: EAL domain-containing protein [Cellvibrionaceae bacterium]
MSSLSTYFTSVARLGLSLAAYLLLSIYLPLPVCAASLALSQYAREVWTSREGLPEGTVLSLLEDESHLLWIGTECCLVRFDGERFMRIDDQPNFGQHSFTHVLARGSSGGIWAGFAGGLMYHDGTQFQWFAEAQGLTHPYVYALTASAATLWVGTGGEGIWRLQAGRLTRDSSFSQSDMPAMIYHLLTDSQGRLWAATEGGLLSQNTEGSWYKLPSQGLPAQSVTLLAEGVPGEIWAGTAAGLAKWNGASFEPYTPLLNLPITALFSDRSHALWVGSGDTLFRLTSEGVESLPLNQGSIHAITDDSFGNIWVGTSEGIARLHPGPVATFGKREGLLADEPKSATRRKAGGIWCLDATGTLGHFVDDVYTQDTPTGAIKGGALLGMTEDADGAVWIAGTYLYRFFNGQLQAFDLPGESLSLVEALGDEIWLAQTESTGVSTLYRYANGQFHPIEVGYPLRHIQRIYEDRAGQIWITSSGTGIVRIKGSETQHFGVAEGLPSDTVYGITEDAEGRMWIATRGGMGYIEQNRAVSLAGIRGTPQNASVHIFLDDKDRFWVTESGLGVHVIPRLELLNAARRNAVPYSELDVTSQLLSTRDGLRSLTFSWRRGGIAQSVEGVLYLLTERGLSVVHPNEYSAPIFNGPVSITKPSRQSIGAGKVLLQDRSDALDIDYGAPYLAAASRLEFRTRLGDQRSKWSAPTTARSVRLSNLAPGIYTFEVAARLQGQPWLTDTATLRIEVPPYFYERGWVKALVALALLLLTLWYLRWRMMSAKKLEIFLRQTVDECTAELHQEITERKMAESRALDLAQNLEERVQERTVELEFAKMAVHKSEERFALAVQGAEDGIWDWDLTQHTLYLSPRWKAILGYKDHEFPSTIDAWLAAVHPDDLDLVRDLLIFSETQANIRQEYRMAHKDGREIWVLCRGVVIRDDIYSLPLRAAGSQTDITQRKLTEEALRDSLTRDPVTELPNRALFIDRLDQALLKRRNHESQVTVLLLDIDGFKSINEKFGHAVGDDILREIARRILSSLRQTDTLARLGNDEFAILLLEIEEEYEAQFAIERIKTVLDTPIPLAQQSLKISYSMGVKHVQQGETHADEMLITAENALDHAKQQGGNRIQTVDKKTKGRRELEQELLHAIQANEFVLYYQPLINLTTNTIVGTEALARWNHPKRGLLGPQHFISLLEACGLMDLFSDWVLDTCCKQAALWREEFAHFNMRVSFNLPATHLNSPQLVDNILAALSAHGIPAQCLGIEIVESSLIESNTVVLNNLERLRDIGLPVSIDDFGTGYSSMNYLKNFPVDCIKLDKSFCQGVPDNARDVAICESLLAIAEQLGLKAIVEGVETEKQMLFFQSKPNLIAQGYYFSRPVEAQICAELIRTYNQ